MDRKDAIDLIERILAGDVYAEKKLFDCFSDQVAFILRRRIGWNNSDWQDVRQEIFAALFARIRAGEYDADKGSLAAFLYATVKFKLLDYLKKHRVHNADPIELHFSLRDPDPPPDETFDQAHRKRLIREAIRRLPRRYRQVLYLTIYKQMRIQEAARLLRCSEQKVSNLKSYAIRLLQRHLRDFEDFADNG